MSPIARGVRTFAALIVGVLAAAVTADWVHNTRASATALALGLIAAGVGGLIAYLWAVIPSLPNAGSPLTKALATFLQGVAAGLATVTVADLTKAAAVSAGTQLVRILIASAFGALLTLAQNSAEQLPPAPAPAPPAPPA